MASLSRFRDLHPSLCRTSLKLLDAQNFDTATPVQAATIPLLTSNKDVAVEACTGSGKTLAFVLPLVEILRKLEEPLKKHEVGAMILSPTRELARQIQEVAIPFLEAADLGVPLLLVGGTDPLEDVSKFKLNGAAVLIGTPGRVHDVLERAKDMSVKKLEVLILDEADRLLGMGFEKQLNAIIQKLPKQRRTGLFSATQTEAVEELARAGLRNGVRVRVNTAAGQGGKTVDAGASKTPEGLAMFYTMARADEKPAMLVDFIKSHAKNKMIIYFLTCACVDFFLSALSALQAAPPAGKKKGPSPDPPLLPPAVRLLGLHGRMKQSAREATLAEYAGSEAGCLLCTDLAARGLDIPDVDWILQYDPPQDPAAFVHRVGRTARMGRSGNAVVYLLPKEEPYVEFLSRRQVRLGERAEMAAAGAEAGPVCSRLRALAETDRDVMEKGARAFVSYVRGYKEHHCNFIFTLADLELGRLASAFGLLRLPAMKEVNKARVTEFEPSAVDPESVRFKDKGREKQRQRSLKEKAEKDAEVAAQAAEEKRKQAKVKVEAKPVTAEKRRKQQAREDFEDLDSEYRMLKKLRRGEISEAEFDVATGLMEDEDDTAQQGPSSKHSKKKDKKLRKIK